MTLQTTASMAFFLLFVLIAVLNAFYLIMSVYTNKHYSRIPIVGLVFAILGFYFSPMYWHYWCHYRRQRSRLNESAGRAAGEGGAI